MRHNFFLLRDGVTATSVAMDVDKIDAVRRWIASSIRGSGKDYQKYHLIGYTNLQDISGTDILEELTGTITGTVYKIVNKREMTGSHMEFDLEPSLNG